MSVQPGDVVEHNGEAWAVVELVRSVPLQRRMAPL
jgi:hypothetical protein